MSDDFSYLTGGTGDLNGDGRVINKYVRKSPRISAHIYYFAFTPISGSSFLPCKTFEGL